MTLLPKRFPPLLCSPPLPAVFHVRHACTHVCTYMFVCRYINAYCNGDTRVYVTAESYAARAGTRTSENNAGTTGSRKPPVRWALLSRLLFSTFYSRTRKQTGRAHNEPQQYIMRTPGEQTLVHTRRHWDILVWETRPGLTIVLRSKPIRGVQCAALSSPRTLYIIYCGTLSLSCRQCFPNE